MQILLM